MRPTAVLRSTQRPRLARPITGARVAVWLSAGALGIALGLNLGLPLPHPNRTTRGLAQSNQAEVGVLIFPDLGGVGDYSPDCSGCDGLFESGDLLYAQRDPLPRLDVTLSDATGSRLTMRTRTLAPGRQQTLFRVDAPGAFTVTLATLPDAWQLCPHATRPHRVVASDFGATTMRADIVIALAHGCRRADASATAPTPADATEIADPTASPVATADAAPTSDTATDAAPTSGAAQRATEPSGSAGGDAADAGSRTAAVADTLTAATDSTTASGAVADIAVHLPQTGLAGRTPFGRPFGLALVAFVAAALGEGGRRLQRRRLPPRSGRWPRRAR